MCPESIAQEFLHRVVSIASSTGYPDPASLWELADEAILSLSSELPDLRPVSPSGKPGGLVRVSTPYALIVPDLHARSKLLADLLASLSPISSHRRIIDLILDGQLTLVCLGDILHTEGLLGAERWTGASRHLAKTSGPNAILGRVMDEEMGASLGSLGLVMMLKTRLGGGFHCLKGNHDNIGNTDQNGDMPFFKYALEGAMGAEWFRLRYGDELMKTIRRYERLLPIAAAGNSFCASHAEPEVPLSIADLLEYSTRADVVHALIWTGNDQAKADAVEKCLAALLLPAGDARSAVWLSGHRPVPGAYSLRAGGRLVQIHNPDRRQVAWIDNHPGSGIRGIALHEVGEAGEELRLLASVASVHLDQSLPRH